MNLIQLEEPKLLFAHGQGVEDPRDGLTLFGPLDSTGAYGVRYGVVGTELGIKRFRRWVERIQSPLVNEKPLRSRPPFPGFEAAFGIPWQPEPTLAAAIPDHELASCLHLDDKYKRVYETAKLFASRILTATKDEEAKPDLWFVVIPDDVYRFCRPRSSVPRDLRVTAAGKMKPSVARSFGKAPPLPLFTDWLEDAKAYRYDPDFRHQLKAQLLAAQVPTQIVRESTVAYRDFTKKSGAPIRDLEVMEPDIAWHLSAAAYYKLGARPWKLAGVREGVCYVGLVFKKEERSGDPRNACCAAQMFLDSGDGVVFKGNVGPWYNEQRGHFHLNLIAAHQLAEQAISAYKAKHGGTPPKEMFIHGRVRFSDPEWAGFQEVAGKATKLIGVRIREADSLRLYRQDSAMPILRGLALIRNPSLAFLWTRGFVPRLQTYPGREVPRPLMVDVCRGKMDITTILQDIMGLTKLNYNACRYADGVPVTLKFADAVGEILTSGFPTGDAPLPFRYYI